MAIAASSGCVQTQSGTPPTAAPASTSATTPTPLSANASVANPSVAVPNRPTQVVRGSGVMVAQPPAPPSIAQATQQPQGDITLNFVNADVREVLPRVLGDILHLNYTIDPKVQATVTIQTSRPLQQQDVLPVLEESLRASGLALVHTDGVYRLMASDDAGRTGAVPVTVGSPPATPAGAGYNVQILPLRYASASDLQHTLQPFLPRDAVMQVDSTRNLIILSGQGVDLSTITGMIKAFDVDWIKGMSYAIVPLQTGTPKEVVDNLNNIFGPHGSAPLPGLLTLAPLEQMNAVLVMSPQPSYIEQARTWIERLDRGEAENRPQIYEYHVQNSRAADLAKVLSDLFTSGQVRTVLPQTAPGTTLAAAGGTSGAAGATATSPGLGTMGTPGIGGGIGTGATTPGLSTSGTTGAAGQPSGLLGATVGGTAATPAQNAAAGAEETGAAAENAAAPGAAPPSNLQLPPVRIVADEKNNTLIIYARPRDYAMIQEALQKIDVVPLQVLIEATIAEVTLNNELQYGLQYFFHQHENQFIFGSGTTAITAGTAIAGTFPGFNYILGSTNANVVLNLLSSISNVRVISSPELLVLDHQTASLLVGNAIPIPTAQIQSQVTAGAPLINTVQYVDTGVILKVTPRVNTNGEITLEVGQEVSEVASGTASNTLGPTISERRIESNVTVEDGQTVALGGLIQDTNSVSKEGIPLLSDIPVVGNAFSSNDHSVQRTELMVLLSPRIVHNPAEARSVTDELRRRLRSIQQIDSPMP